MGTLKLGEDERRVECEWWERKLPGRVSIQSTQILGGTVGKLYRYFTACMSYLSYGSLYLGDGGRRGRWRGRITGKRRK